MSKILTSRFYKRSLSAIILAPVCLWVLISGGIAFYILIGVILGLSLSEWVGLTRLLSGKQRYIYGLAGFIYLLGCIYSFLLLPLYFNIMLLVGVWFSDIGAYLIGKKFGRWKVVPTISPNKTLAGFIGACLSPALVLAGTAVIYTELTSLPTGSVCDFRLYQIGGDESWKLDPFIVLSWIEVFWIFIFVGIAGQAGDLLISAMKRKVEVKDTGKLIPGHGGILDRIDAILLASPAFLGLLILIKEISC